VLRFSPQSYFPEKKSGDLNQHRLNPIADMFSEQQPHQIKRVFAIQYRS